MNGSDGDSCTRRAPRTRIGGTCEEFRLVGAGEIEGPVWELDSRCLLEWDLEVIHAGCATLLRCFGLRGELG